MSENNSQIRRSIKRSVIRDSKHRIILDQEEYTEISPEGDITSISTHESLIVNGDRIVVDDIRGNCELCETFLIEPTYVKCPCSRVICLRCSRNYEEILYCPICFRSVRLRGILSSIGRFLSFPFRKRTN